MCLYKFITSAYFLVNTSFFTRKRLKHIIVHFCFMENYVPKDTRV